MEVVCESDYQDIYRITDGVLLVINKFEYMTHNGETLYIYQPKSKRIWKRYIKGCKDHLRELTTDYKDIYGNYVLPKGTVVYGSHPVQKVSPDKWKYQIKTTGELFSGTAEDIFNYMKTIREITDSKKKGG